MKLIEFNKSQQNVSIKVTAKWSSILGIFIGCEIGKKCRWTGSPATARLTALASANFTMAASNEPKQDDANCALT